MIARVTVAAVAILVLSWLGIMERDANLLVRARSRSAHVSQRVKATCARSPSARPDCRLFTGAVSDARRAELLNPDTTPRLFGGLLSATGQRPRQAAVADEVLRSEPDNLGAWTALLLAAQGRDPQATQRAVQNLRRVDPLHFASR